MTDIPPRWYCVDAHGLATLCAGEDNARTEAAENDILWPRNAPHTAVQLAPVPAKPTITPEQARDTQHWAGMDGATAWHLIDRHADGWGDVGAMMDAWLEANRAPVPAQGAEGVEALARSIGRKEFATAREGGMSAHWVLSDDELQEFARRLRNSPQPDVAAEVLRIADERESGYSRREHGAVVNGKAADAVVALAERLRNSPQPINSGPFGAFYVCPTCSGTGAVTQAAHDAARSAGGDDEA